MLIRLVVRAPFLVIGSTIMAMMIDWRLSLIFLAAAPLIAGTIYLIMSRSIPFYRITQKLLDRVSLITRENLSGARVIRAFSRQKRSRSVFMKRRVKLNAPPCAWVKFLRCLIQPPM